MADKLNINIMMIGGRRCGKTSVLAIMKRMFDTKFATTNLKIVPTNRTVELDDKYQEMVDVYSNEKGKRISSYDLETLSKEESMKALNQKSTHSKEELTILIFCNDSF